MFFLYKSRENRGQTKILQP